MASLSSIFPGFGLMDSFLHPEKAYKKAGEQAEQYYGQAQDYLQPYNQYGQDAYQDMSGAMQSLLNPAALQDEWASGYQTSPYAQMQQERAQNQGLNAASSMGLMGSSPALQAIQAGTSNIGMADQNNYMDNLMQKYLAGAGLAQNIYGTGAAAGGQMGQNAMNQGVNMAQSAYGQQAAPGNLMGGLIGTAVGAATGSQGTNPSATQQPWSTGG